MMRGKCLAAAGFALALILGAQSAVSENTASGTTATVPVTHVSAIDVEASACSAAIKTELSEAIGTVPMFDVALFESSEVQAALTAVGSAGSGAPPWLPATGACGIVYESDTTSCDACCGRNWGDYIRWCGTQPNCQACQDQAREWKRQCQQGCVDGASWAYPQRCSEKYGNHADCFNCCVSEVNDMNLWCQLAYPNDRVKRQACEADVQNWTLSCLSACPQ